MLPLGAALLRGAHRGGLLCERRVLVAPSQDRQQKIAGDDFLKNKGPVMKEMIEAGIPALFVCAGYQAVGRYYKPYQGDSIPGPGIFDLYTEHPGDQAKRLIGNTVAELIVPPELKGKTIVGFENHGGRTYLGKNMKPLGVLSYQSVI